MHPQIEKVREDYLLENEIYYGRMPNYDTKDIPNEDILLYTNISIASDLEYLRNKIPERINLIQKSVKGIEDIVVFWFILTLIGLGFMIYGVVKITEFMNMFSKLY